MFFISLIGIGIYTHVVVLSTPYSRRDSLYINTHTHTHYIHGYGSNMRYIILRENVYWPVTRDGNAFFGSCFSMHTHKSPQARTMRIYAYPKTSGKKISTIYIRKPVYVPINLLYMI